jgi:hypothetical protein
MGAHLDEAQGLAQEQVYGAHDHGAGATLPSDWPADWRDSFEKSAEQLPVTPPAPQ